jgi:hypothetical protein
MRLLVEAGNERADVMAAASTTHDTYQKALDRLLRGLRVEKGVGGL